MNDKDGNNNSGGAIIVLTVIWGSVLYFLANNWNHIISSLSSNSLMASFISFLW